MHTLGQYFLTNSPTEQLDKYHESYSFANHGNGNFGIRKYVAKRDQPCRHVPKKCKKSRRCKGHLYTHSSFRIKKKTPNDSEM